MRSSQSKVLGFAAQPTRADEVRYPIILADMPEPQLRVYPRYTVVAEKLEALTSLGMLNSRMKDFFDLWVLAQHADFDVLTND